MAITYISSTEQTTATDATPLDFTFDIGTRTNGLLVVMLGTVDNVTHTHANPTWNGVAMGTAVSHVFETTTGVFQRLSLYYLANPANGSNAFSVDYDDGTTDTASVAYIVPAWVDGAHQTQASVLDQINSGNGSVDPALFITPTEDNEILFGFCASEADTVLTAGAGETGIQSQDHGTRVMGAAYAIQTTAIGQTVNFGGTDANWLMVTASFKQAASGTNTPKSVDGTLTSAGAIIKATTKSPGGTLTTAGAIVKSVAKAFAGALTSAGALATARGYARFFTGTLTTSGDIVRSTAKLLAGVLTTAGDLITQTAGEFAQEVGGTLTMAGALVRSTSKRLAGELTFEGIVTASRTFLQSMAGTLTSAGSLTRGIGKNLAGTLAPSGAISKAITKTFAGTLSWIGSLIAALVGEEVALLDVTLTAAAVYAVALADSAVYTATLTNSAVYTVTLSDTTRS